MTGVKMLKRWKVSRYLKAEKKQGEYIVHADSIQKACLMEGHTMTAEETEQSGYSFYQKFSDCLEENKVQKVWIRPF